ncbi:hypothetical protein OG455_08185 [Kitasatospora sp. NBC_01287]|uniref:hypothetical protein n=1 Tax=Kitasatospora sp. NBC_01287 TaxID=2903573 RepID=UPI002258CCD7|nr:hypothetical protein [Kitasatospora sp. NBC_01287]MCX4745500.1 hypothetical protein [Kitasatospora sp. NBC_01287]
MSEPTDSESPTPDHLLHTGAEHPVDPIDLVMASGQDPTPALIEKARRSLERDGAAAVERVLP